MSEKKLLNLLNKNPNAKVFLHGKSGTNQKRFEYYIFTILHLKSFQDFLQTKIWKVCLAFVSSLTE